MTHGPRIVGVVLTRNEAEHLPGCLRSLRLLTADALVLDSGSTDGTQQVACRASARVVTRSFDGFANQRNAALELVVDAEWVVFLDADERLTAAGAAELRAALARAPEGVAGFALPRRNICFGRALRGGGWWPDAQTRAVRPRRARYDATRQVHETVALEGELRRLREPLTHLNYATRREFVAEQAAYTRLRVADARAAGAVPRRRAYLGAPARELWRRLGTLRGYRDGATGVFLASVLAWEEARATWLLRHGTCR